LNSYESWESPSSALTSVEFVGRGGTDFRPVFEWVDDTLSRNEGLPDLVAYLTDGFGPFPKVAPPYPVVWLMPEGSEVVPPFGLRINIF